MFVEEEKGQWVVYLEVTFWEDEGEFPLSKVRHRISTYRTRRQAEIAAEYIRRGADRDIGTSFLE